MNIGPPQGSPTPHRTRAGIRLLWPGWRKLLLVSVLAAAAALPAVTTTSERRDNYFFEVMLTSTQPGFTELFWDRGSGLSEGESSRQPLRVESAPFRYRYMMPVGTFRGLRFDPTDTPGRMTISGARIVDRFRNVLREFPPSDFIPGQQIGSIESDATGLRIEVAPGSWDPTLDIVMEAPLELPLSPRAWLTNASPVFLLVLAAGWLVASPGPGTGLARLVRAAWAWMAPRPRTAIAVIATLAVAVQIHPVLFLGRSFVSPSNGALMLYGRAPTLPGMTETMYADGMGSDVGAMLFQHLYYPIIQRDALLGHGEWPLWNRHNLAGVPLLGQGQSMFGDPLNMLTILADSAPWSWDLRFAIMRWLLAAGLGVTVWQLGRNLPASLLVTLGGGFLGFFTFRLIHPANFSLAYAPWILWAWAGLSAGQWTRRGRLWLLGLVVTHGLVLTSGTAKEAVMLVVCLDFAGLMLVLLRQETRGDRLRLLAFAAGAIGVFVLAWAPHWLTFLSALAQSRTAYDTPSATQLELAQIVGLFDEIFHRRLAPGEVVVAPSSNLLFMVGFALWAGCLAAWREDRTGLSLVIASLPPLALAFGIVPSSLILHVPFIANLVHLGNVFSCPLLILTSVLAGRGFARVFSDGAVSGSLARRVAGPVLFVSALLGAYWTSTWDSPSSGFFTGYAGGALIASGLLLLALTAWRGSPATVVLVLALGIPILLWRHMQHARLDAPFNHFAWTPAARVPLEGPSPAVDIVQGRLDEPRRVVGLQANLYPSYQTRLGWESLYGVDAVMNPHYHDLAGAAGMHRVFNWDHEVPVTEAAGLRPVFDMLGVGAYLADPAGPAGAIAGLERIAQADLDVHVSATAWPRAFFTDRLSRYSDAPDLVNRIRAGDGRPFAAVQHAQSDHPSMPENLSGRVVRAATAYRLTPNTTTFEVDATGRGIAVLTETYYPGDFRVTINGEPSGYFRVNHAFKGVLIERAGRHVVQFTYWPRHFTLALALGIGGILTRCAGFFLLGRFPGHR